MKWLKIGTIFFDSDICATSIGLYPIKNLTGGKSNLRVVFIRSRIKEKQLLMHEDPSKDDYQYYSIITNMDS